MTSPNEMLPPCTYAGSGDELRDVFSKVVFGLLCAALFALFLIVMQYAVEWVHQWILEWMMGFDLDGWAMSL